MRHLFGLSVQALRAPPGSGNSPEDRLPVFRPSSQYRWVACRPVSGSIRGLRGPLRAHPAVRPATGRESRSGGELELRLRRGPRGRPCRQPYPLQIGPDRDRIGEGGEDPQAPATGGHALSSAENTRASRAAHPNRWPQGWGSDRRPQPATPQPAWPARCGRGPGHGAPGHRGSAGDGAGAGGPELPVSPAVPGGTVPDGWSHPTKAF